MLLDDSAGLPRLRAQGFEVTPPRLPPEVCLEAHPKAAPTHQIGQFHLSFLTVNVNSLCRGPDGISGKLDFLRAQVRAHCLNYVGVQGTQ